MKLIWKIAGRFILSVLYFVVAGLSSVDHPRASMFWVFLGCFQLGIFFLYIQEYEENKKWRIYVK